MSHGEGGGGEGRCSLLKVFLERRRVAAQFALLSPVPNGYPAGDRGHMSREKRRFRRLVGREGKGGEPLFGHFVLRVVDGVGFLLCCSMEGRWEIQG